MPGLTGLHQGNAMQPADSTRTVTVSTATYTIKGYEAALLLSYAGAMEIIFPSAAEVPGQTICLHLKGTYTVTCTFISSQIAPALTDTFGAANEWCLFYSDGYGWYVLSFGASNTKSITVA